MVDVSISQTHLSIAFERITVSSDAARKPITNLIWFHLSEMKAYGLYVKSVKIEERLSQWAITSPLLILKGSLSPITNFCFPRSLILMDSWRYMAKWLWKRISWKEDAVDGKGQISNLPQRVCLSLVNLQIHLASRASFFSFYTANAQASKVKGASW